MKILEDMPTVLSLENFTMNTDSYANGSTAKNHISLKKGQVFFELVSLTSSSESVEWQERASRTFLKHQKCC